MNDRFHKVGCGLMATPFGKSEGCGRTFKYCLWACSGRGHFGHVVGGDI